MDASDEELAILVGLSANTTDEDYETNLLRTMNKGENYRWDATAKVRSLYIFLHELKFIKTFFLKYL